MKKILIWSDSPRAKTGFGNVASNLFKNLHDNGKNKVVCVGINDYGLDYKLPEGFTNIVPTSTDDKLGYNRLAAVAKDFEPDIIILFQDVYHVIRALDFLPEDTPKILYFPIDGGPYSSAWVEPLKHPSIKKIFQYSNYAIAQISPFKIPTVDPKPLYHGISSNTYLPVRNAVRSDLRKKFGVGDKFLVLNVNRFQPRKQITLSLHAAALITYGYKECVCGNYYHTTTPSCPLCNSEKVVRTAAPNDDLFFYPHCSIAEETMGTSEACLLINHCRTAGYPPDAVGKNITINTQNLAQNPLTNEQVNVLYNICDINLTTAVGEGCGLSLLEASATKTTSIAPNNSAIPEQLGGSGRLVKCCAYASFGLDNGYLRPIPSVPAVVDAIEEEYNLWVENGRRKVFNEAAYAHVQKNHLWPAIRERFLAAVC